MRVLDLDQDGLISRTELADAIRFLKDNLSEADVDALLDSLSIRAEGAGASGGGGGPAAGGGDGVISVEQLRRLAEQRAGGESGAATTAAPAEGAAKESAQIHIL